MAFVSDVIARIEKGIGIFLISSMAIIVALAVLFRYFIHAPLSWAGEASIYLMIWMSFVGGSLGLKYKSQASVTFLIDLLPNGMKNAVLITGHILILTFLCIILYYSYIWVFSPSVANQVANSTQIPMWIPYSAVPVGLTFATVHIINNLVQLFKKEDAE